MIKYIDYDLYKFNTMRLHCIAKEYYEPESIDELLALTKELNSKHIHYYILGGGSNILMPESVECVISIHSFDKSIKIESGIVRSGTSVRIQTLIRKLQQNELGGIEYLYSLPCLIGGAVYMNAGRGGLHGDSIGNYVQSVMYLDTETSEIYTIPAEECCFAHRSSVFQHRKWIILSVEFKFEYKAPEDVEKAVKDRLDHCKKVQDANKPNCGSVFSQYNFRIMSLLKGLRHGGAAYSSKTTNWITNVNNATYKDILCLIRFGQFIHKILFQAIKTEIVIWKKRK